MLSRFKRAIVQSYIGAIALGYLFAQIVFYFVGVFATPVATWATESHFHQDTHNNVTPTLSLLTSVPDVIRFTLSLTLWYLLLWWLYMKSSGPEKSEPSTESQ